MRLLGRLVLWGLLNAGAHAQPLPLDTLGARPVPQSVLDAYRADPDYQYDRPDAEGPSLAALAWRWVQRTLLTPLARASQTDAGTWALVALAVAALAWAAARVVRADGGGVFERRHSRAPAIGPLMDVDNLGTVDLAPLLAAALARGHLREAVRYRYLLLLQRLDAAGALAWRRDKTNRDYAHEVGQHASATMADAFADVTRSFDYVWYGERPVDKARYARLDPLWRRAERLAEALVARPMP